MTLRILALALLAVVLSGCPKPATLPPIEAATPVAAPAFAGEAMRPVQFHRLVIGMPADHRIGTYTQQMLCAFPGDFSMEGRFSGRAMLRDSDLSGTFVRTMRSVGLPTVGVSESMFGAAAPEAEVLVAGTISDFQGNFCADPINGHGRGEAMLRVSWQVLDRRTGGVQTIETSGQGKSEWELRGANRSISLAFGENARSLLRHPDFVRVATRSAEPSIRSAGVQIAAVPSFSGPLQTRVAQIQAAVVTVLAGTGHGSGFVIGRDGYVLTAAHVVAQEATLRVRFSTGIVVDAELVGLHPQRDVALLRVPRVDGGVLPIAVAEPPIGSEAYAIGSPLDQALSGSVTRGIVSGYPTIDGRRYLQSDAAMLPGNSGGPLVDTSGNVVGLAVWSLGARTGVALTVPIAEALDAVGLSMVRGRPAS